MSPRPSPAILVLMFVSLAGLGTMSQFFRSMIAVIAPELSAEFALSGKELSVIVGVYFMAHASMQLPMGLATAVSNAGTLLSSAPLAYAAEGSPRCLD